MHRIRAAVGAVVLLAIAVAPRARAEEAPSPWKDEAELRLWLDEACSAVEKVTGDRFEKRPTLRISDKESLETVLLAEFARLDPGALHPDAAKAAAASLAFALLAKYAPDEHVIHVQPAAFQVVARLQPSRGPLGPAHTRVLLAHEATHALDFSVHRLHESMRAAKDASTLDALGAVSEGHAQFVAHAVAAQWGLNADFERFTHAIVGDAEVDLPEVARLAEAMTLASVRFAYSQGRAFFDAVFAARGLEGVRAVLRDPPTNPEWIEHPERYLAPETRRVRRDLKAILATVDGLFPPPHYRSTVVSPRRDQLAVMASRLPEDRRATYLQGFDVGASQVVTREGVDGMTVFALLEFTTEADARRFEEDGRELLARSMGEPGSKDEIRFDELRRREALGPDGSWPGLFIERNLVTGGTTVLMRTVLIRRGPLVIELVSLGHVAVDEAVLMRALERFVTAANDLEAARALPPLAPVLPPPSAPEVPESVVPEEEPEPAGAPR